MPRANDRDGRERLIEAAAQELWANGYAATSPADIQRVARAGQGSMYHHFAGKAELARAAIERLARDLDQELATALDSEGPGLDRVLAYLERERDPLRGCRVGRLTADPDVIGQDLLRAPITDTLGRLQTRLAGALADAQQAGELDPSLDCAAIAATVAAVVQGGYVLARAEQDPAAFHQAIKGACSLLAIAAVTPTNRRPKR
ncbi:MAG: TetR/AcrR family transcriptional regulator [Solirubrobacterales bacterium]|nr:TetR/AcrR family transcriptional regulator [Solirubrobacterales bacterium]